MKKFGTLADAVDLAEYAHRNQFDKAGLPYIDHPKRVLAKIQAQGLLPYVQIAAVLHDVTEDTAFTPEMLLGLGFSEAAVEVVDLMDRDRSALRFLVEPRRAPGQPFEGISEDDYYYECLRENPGAYKVKVADMDDNMEDWRLAYLPQDTQKRLRKKYRHGLRVMMYGWENAAHREQFIYE